MRPCICPTTARPATSARAGPTADRTAARVARHHCPGSVSAQPSLGVLTWYPAAPRPSTVPSGARSSALTWLVPRSSPRTAGGRGTSAGLVGVPAVITRDRPHLDGAVPGRRVLRRHLDALVQVGAVDHVVAGDLLLGLGERPVADQQFAAADLQRGGVADVPEPVAVQAH